MSDIRQEFEAFMLEHYLENDCGEFVGTETGGFYKLSAMQTRFVMFCKMKESLRAIIEQDNVEPVGEIIGHDGTGGYVVDFYKEDIPSKSKIFLHPPKDSTEPASKDWISVDDRLPKIDLPIYFYDGEEVYNGEYGEYSVEDESIKLEGLFNVAYKTIKCFQAYNHGYDGDNAPVYGVTHWQYENIPAAPTTPKGE